jgi:hypothetical protein
MSAVNVPSGIAFGVTLMPAKPVSPFSAVKVERYVPGGGSNFVGDGAEDVVEEHAPISRVQTMIGTVMRIDRSHGNAAVHTGLFVIDIPPVSRSGNQRRILQIGKKGLE